MMRALVRMRGDASRIPYPLQGELIQSSFFRDRPSRFLFLPSARRIRRVVHFDARPRSPMQAICSGHFGSWFTFCVRRCPENPFAGLSLEQQNAVTVVQAPRNFCRRLARCLGSHLMWSTVANLTKRGYRPGDYGVRRDAGRRSAGAADWDDIRSDLAWMVAGTAADPGARCARSDTTLYPLSRQAEDRSRPRSAQRQAHH